MKNLKKYSIIDMFGIYVPVAQLDRVSDSDSEGRAFESHQAYQKKSVFKPFLGLY